MDNINILLIEDNQGDAVLMREALNAAAIQHTIHEVNKGTLAVDCLRRLCSQPDGRPHLIILDLNLPGQGGRGVMGEIEADPALAGMPIAIFTSSSYEKDIGKEFPGLRTTFAVKTADFQELMETMVRFKTFAEEAAGT